MKCPRRHYINIVSATYGRSKRGRCTKQNVPQNGCEANDSLLKLKNHIGRTCGIMPRVCTAVASNNIFGDPCPGVHKYLELKYECRRNRSHGMYVFIF